MLLEIVYAVLILAIELYKYCILTLMIFEWVRSYVPHYRPRGIWLVIASIVEIVTDPPRKLIRKLIPGHVARIFDILILYLLLIVVQIVISSFGMVMLQHASVLFGLQQRAL